MKSDSLLLYAVTDRSYIGKKSLSQKVQEVIEGGATFIQLREKNLNQADLLLEAKEIQALCKKAHIPFVINDDVQLAKEIDADGVHVGQEDMEAASARELLGPDKIVGVSAQTVEQALLAEQMGADYLGVGAVFQTNSKDDAEDVSYETLKAICEAVSIPVIAIGGIHKDNVLQLKGSGIVGIAVISALFSQEDSRQATQELKEKVLKLYE